jgi:hypothetical protein
MSAERLELSTEWRPLVGGLNKEKTRCGRPMHMSAERLELSTNGLKGHCSAN